MRPYRISWEGFLPNAKQLKEAMAQVPDHYVCTGTFSKEKIRAVLFDDPANWRSIDLLNTGCILRESMRHSIRFDL